MPVAQPGAPKCPPFASLCECNKNHYYYHRRMPLTWCSVGCSVAPRRSRPARPMLSAIMGYMFTCSQHHRLAPPLCSTPLPRAGSLCPRPQRHLGVYATWEPPPGGISLGGLRDMSGGGGGGGGGRFIQS